MAWLAMALWLALDAGAAERRPRSQEDVFGDSPIRHFQINIASDELQKLRRNNSSYAHATVAVDGQVFTNVGVRLKGQGSFKPVDQKPSFAVKFNEFVPTQKFHGLTKIMLNNASQDSSLLSEYLATSLFRDAGVPAAQVTHARVSLNGRELGLYVLIEAMNKAFLKDHFSDASGNLYEGYSRDIDQKLEQDGGVPGDQSDLRALVSAARLPASDRMPRLREVLDVERFHSFLAVSTLIAQHDSYQYNRNNYRIYHDPKSSRFVMIPHGIDGTFSENHISIRPPTKYILTKALLDTDEGRPRHREILGNLFTNVFRLDVVTNRIELVTKRLQAAVTDEQERTNIASRATAFLRRVAKRHESVAQQLSEPDPRPLAVAPNQPVKLTGWKASVDAGKADLEIGTFDGQRALQIKNVAEMSIGAWRTRVILDPGRYRFIGRAHTAKLVAPRGSIPILAPANAMAMGVSLRAFKMYVAPKRAMADEGWSSLEHPFTVTRGEEEVELICDLRAHYTQAWFDLDSLELRRDP